MGRSGVRVLHFFNRSPQFWGGDRTEDRRPGHKDTVGPGRQAQSRAGQSSHWPIRLPAQQPHFLLSPVSARWATPWAGRRLVSSCCAQEPAPEAAPYPETSTCPAHQHPSPPLGVLKLRPLGARRGRKKKWTKHTQQACLFPAPSKHPTLGVFCLPTLVRSGFG